MAWTRLVIYLLGVGASVLAIAGLADFDPMTGVLAVHPFNLYAVGTAAVGGLSSMVAAVAWLKGWKGKS